jgi:hypothetical protein
VERWIKGAIGDARVVKQSERLFRLATGAFSRTLFHTQTYINSFIGVSVTQLLNLNLSVFPHRIHAETRVLVDEKVAAGTCVLYSAILALAHHVKLPPVWNVTARKRRLSLSVVGLM